MGNREIMDDRLRRLIQQRHDADDAVGQAMLNWKLSRQGARDYLAAKESVLSIWQEIARLYPDFDPHIVEPTIENHRQGIEEIKREIPKISREYPDPEWLG